MKIAIISDTHDNIPNIEKAINWLNKEKIKTLLHCGDVSTRETMEFISQKFPSEIFAVFGNMDIGKNDNWNFPNVKIFEEIGEVKLEGRKIVFTHLPETAKKLAKTGKYDIVFYGHTHKPWEEKIGECQLVNPGNLAGILYKATFATYDTKTNLLGLKIIDNL